MARRRGARLVVLSDFDGTLAEFDLDPTLPRIRSDAFAALGYDAAYVLVDAIKRAGTTEGPKLRDALAATRNFTGASGVTTIDDKRNATKGATIIAIKDGKLQFSKTVAP